METAVQFIEEKLDNLLELYTSEWEKVNEVLDQAKEMEKNQIIGAYQKGRFNYEDWDKGIKKNLVQSEQFFNETYGSKGSDETKN